MADSSDYDSPMVKLAIALLDDNHGITTEAWEALVETFKQYYGTRPLPELLQKIILAIQGGEGRVFLDEGWDDGVLA